jgi:iron complex transport system permease protein
VIGSDNKRVIPYSALLGAILLLLSDTVGRVLIQPVEIPVGVMTAIMGGPFFIFLLRRQKMR